MREMAVLVRQDGTWHDAVLLGPHVSEPHDVHRWLCVRLSDGSLGWPDWRDIRVVGPAPSDWHTHMPLPEA